MQAGWLVRRPGTSRTGETLEPSEEVLGVLDALQRWDTPHRSVTASRIETLGQALQTLALESDPDVSRRLGELERERERIDRQIEATHHQINAGDTTIIKGSATRNPNNWIFESGPES